MGQVPVEVCQEHGGQPPTLRTKYFKTTPPESPPPSSGDELLRPQDYERLDDFVSVTVRSYRGPRAVVMRIS